MRDAEIPARPVESLAGRHCLVTGGTGFIGSYVATELARAGATIRIAARRRALCPYELVFGDLRDLPDARRAVEGVDTVLHLAGYADVTGAVANPTLAFQGGDVVTFNMLEACRAAGVSRFIYCSSARVYGDPVHVPVDEQHPLHPKEPYGTAKLTGELWTTTYCVRYGMEVTILRPFSVYGPGRVPRPGSLSGVLPIFVERALNGDDIVISGTGEQTKDFTYVTDVARAFRLVCEHRAAKGLVLNIGAGRGVSVRHLADVILSVTGSRSQVVYRPDDGTTVSNYADSSAAKRALGWEPLVQCEEGVAKYVQWYGMHGLDTWYPWLGGGAYD